MPIVTDQVAGPYRATYAGPAGANPASAHLGVIGSRGIRQIRRFEGEDFSADLGGNSVIDTVYLGGQMFLEFELEEANLQNVLAIANPFKTTVGNPTADGSNEMGVPGTFMSAKAGQLILEPLYGGSVKHTPASNQVTPLRTYGLVTLAAGFDQEQLFASRRRVIPVRLRCYPYSDGGTPAKYIWFSLGAISGTYHID